LQPFWPGKRQQPVSRRCIIRLGEEGEGEEEEEEEEEEEGVGCCLVVVRPTHQKKRRVT
jgi:hypothetical protein